MVWDSAASHWVPPPPARRHPGTEASFPAGPLHPDPATAAGVTPDFGTAAGATLGAATRIAAVLERRNSTPAEIEEAWRRAATAAPSMHGASRGHAKAQRIDAVYAEAERLGLTGPIGDTADLVGWDAPPDDFELHFERQLRESTIRRVRRSTEPEAVQHTLTWVRLYRATFPHRTLFHELTGGPGDAHAQRKNDCTFTQIAEFMRFHGSIKPGQRGRTLQAGTIEGVIGTLRALRGREAGRTLLDRSTHLEEPRIFKDMRREDGPRVKDSDLRMRRAGFRATHFRQAADRGFDRASREGRRRWAGLHAGHNGVARAGELGVTNHAAPFEHERGITCADVILLDDDATGTGRRGLLMYVFPIKDTSRRHYKQPTPISERPAGSYNGPGDDPNDAYLAVRAEYDIMLTEVPPDMRPYTPFFRRPGTFDAVTTADVARWVAEARAAIGGLPEVRADDELAHELRIGGARDYYELYGFEGRQLLEERGRWHSDIYFIYAGVSATQHFEASARVGDAGGPSLQDIAPGWTQAPVVTGAARAAGSGGWGRRR